MHIPVGMMTQRSRDILETTLMRTLVTRTIVRWKLSSAFRLEIARIWWRRWSSTLLRDIVISREENAGTCGANSVDQISKVDYEKLRNRTSDFKAFREIPIDAYLLKPVLFFTSPNFSTIISTNFNYVLQTYICFAYVYNTRCD